MLTGIVEDLVGFHEDYYSPQQGDWQTRAPQHDKHNEVVDVHRTVSSKIGILNWPPNALKRQNSARLLISRIVVGYQQAGEVINVKQLDVH